MKISPICVTFSQPYCDNKTSASPLWNLTKAHILSVVTPMALLPASSWDINCLMANDILSVLSANKYVLTNNSKHTILIFLITQQKPNRHEVQRWSFRYVPWYFPLAGQLDSHDSSHMTAHRNRDSQKNNDS